MRRAAKIDRKPCIHCGASIIKNSRQGNAAWERRKFCNKRCEFSYGCALTLRPCMACGLEIMRRAKSWKTYCANCFARSTVKTAERIAWSDIKSRCYNPKVKNYASYGGRGIIVCDRWKNSFDDFLSDVGVRPSSKHSLDRIDNNGPYAPGNCKWSTKKEQNNNTRRTLRFTFRGEEKTLGEWAALLGFQRKAIWNRIHVNRWPVDRAFTEPIRRLNAKSMQD